MPSIYLSPSVQEFNLFYDNSGSEEYYMNLIADYMEPYLIASGIDFTRNTPSMTLAQVINQSNAGNYDLHLALHSNASGPGNEGKQQGTDVYYYQTSTNGKRAAEITAENFKDIYPYPQKVKTVPNTTFAELKRTTAPAILIEIAYHDNPEDAEWIKNNLQLIAKTLVISVCEYLGVPFSEPTGITAGTVTTAGSRLNMRDKPSFDGAIIDKIPNGTVLTVVGENGAWYSVQYNGKDGYAYKQYITV